MVKNQSHLVSLTLVLNGVKLETLLTTNMNTSFLFSHKLLYVMEYKSFQKNYVFHLFERVVDRLPLMTYGLKLSLEG